MENNSSKIFFLQEKINVMEKIQKSQLADVKFFLKIA